MYRCSDEKISKTENKVTVAHCDVENLDHQNWQLLEGKSYITSISIIKQKISLKNGTGSRFGRKKGWDGGIEKKKKAGKRDLRTPIVDPHQYAVPGTVAACRIFYFWFPSAWANIRLWPLVPFIQISSKNSELKTTHNTFRVCRVHFIWQPFSK